MQRKSGFEPTVRGPSRRVTVRATCNVSPHRLNFNLARARTQYQFGSVGVRDHPVGEVRCRWCLDVSKVSAQPVLRPDGARPQLGC